MQAACGVAAAQCAGQLLNKGKKLLLHSPRNGGSHHLLAGALRGALMLHRLPLEPAGGSGCNLRPLVLRFRQQQLEQQVPGGAGEGQAALL